MSKTVDEFEELLDKVIKSRIPIQTQWVTLQNIRIDEKLCDAKDVESDLEFYDIWLGLGSENKKPKDNTIGLIGLIENNPAKAFLITCKELEQWEVNVGNSSLKIEDGFLLKKENETLKKLMADLIKAIKAMKFTTNNGPTIKLINIADFMALEKRFNNLLK